MKPQKRLRAVDKRFVVRHGWTKELKDYCVWDSEMRVVVFQTTSHREALDEMVKLNKEVGAYRRLR